VRKPWYAFRSAISWKPPGSEMICRLMCFCRILPPRVRTGRARCSWKGARDEAEADFLVEHLEDFLARAVLEQTAVHVQARDRLSARERRAEIERLVLGGVVLAQAGPRQDDVLNLSPY
jgi:hypothetical protein